MLEKAPQYIDSLVQKHTNRPSLNIDDMVDDMEEHKNNIIGGVVGRNIHLRTTKQTHKSKLASANNIKEIKPNFNQH